jgi:hypothetical protein
MAIDVGREVAALRRMTANQLRDRYVTVFGEETRANNRAWLVKRIAWRIQANAEGDLSERARRRADELANDADLRVLPPRTPISAPAAGSTVEVPVPALKPDHRLPPPGTILTRKYKGGLVRVQVLADGFEYEGGVYASLSAVAKAVTGSHCNGFLFFRLGNYGGER